MRSAPKGRRVAAMALFMLAALLPGQGVAEGACAFATPAEAKAMAERAATYLAEVGPEKAFATFMDPKGRFIDRDLYVFVLDMEGTLWVNGAFPQAIGGNSRGARDRRGRAYIEEMLRLAGTTGEGWVEYDFFNPCTRELAPKASYVKRVGPFNVGVGAYGTVSP